MSTHTVYLVVEKGRFYWNSKISKITRKQPTITIDQALVKLNVQIPDNIFEPHEVTCKVLPEHIKRPTPEVESEQP